MKYLLFFLLSVVFQPEEEQTIVPNHPFLRYAGRVDWSDTEKPIFSWSAVQVRFRFEGTFCRVVLNDYFGGTNPPKTCFSVFVDDKQTMVFCTEVGKTDYILAENLPKGAHEIVLFKRTEAATGAVRLVSIHIDGDGKLLESPPAPTRKIEFVGNSITCGYGNEGDVKTCPFTPETENAYLTYAAITARNLLADYTKICYSGIGVFRNYSDKIPNTMPNLYDRVCPTNDSVKYDFSKWQPDVVCLNLGTNDFARNNPDSVGFCTAYLSFLQEIRLKNPKATIICLVGSMRNDDYPKNTKSLSTIKNHINKTLAVFRSTNDQNIDFFEMSQQGQYGYGCSFHPNLKQHEQNGAELTTFIKQKMKW